jgi:hypothetical protein
MKKIILTIVLLLATTLSFGQTGTVTSVAPLTIGTSGTDVSSTVVTNTTTPVITLNIPSASITARGLITTGNQYISGKKTFNNGMIINETSYNPALVVNGDISIADDKGIYYGSGGSISGLNNELTIRSNNLHLQGDIDYLSGIHLNETSVNIRALEGTTFNILGGESFGSPNQATRMSITPNGNISFDTRDILGLGGGGTFNVNGMLSVSGNNALNFSNYGGGLYMIDNYWIRTYGGKNFYHNTGVMRTDGVFHVGPNGDRFVVTQDGKTGIGTTTPASKLDVRGVISTPEIAFRNADGGDDSDPYRLRKVQGSSNNNWLELQLNDDPNESFRIYGNSCAGFGCGEYSNNLYHSFDAQGNVFHSGNVGIGTTDPKSKLHVFGQENGAFNGLVIDNRKNYGVGSGIDQTSRILLSLSENLVPNPLDRIFGIIESGTLSESDSSNGRLSFYVRQGGDINEKMRINYNGKVGIGTTNPDEMLTVNGTIHAKEVIVDTAITPDFVFQKYYTGKSELKSDYVMPTLAEIESFTKKNNHLPNVPSAKEVQQKGVSLGEMSNVLLQKVEELTLYAIEQNKELERLKKENEYYKSLAERLSVIEKELKK